MLRSLRPVSLPLACFSCLVFLSWPGLRAQQDCNVEVKVLLLPVETQAAVAMLGAERETAEQVYFFVTDALDLLARGVIVRLRRGAQNDLTVKVRPLNAHKFSATSPETKGFKCELDRIGDVESPSYSISYQLEGDPLPRTGVDVSKLLNAAQMGLLNDAQIPVDWARVHRLTAITSTTWQIPAQFALGKLSIELWEWPGGKIRELSTKVPPDSGASAYAELQRLLKTKHLSISDDQRVKTTIALNAITHATAH
jgi:hypothetical protein